MLEIIALYFLCKKNGNLAVQKGLKPSTWKWYTIIAWVVTEMFGVLLGFDLFGQENILGVMLLALLSAFGGYLFIKFVLEKKPDSMDEEINNIRAEDLHPPKR